MAKTTTYQPPFVLAIDIGSSSTRSGIFDRALNPVSGSFAQTNYSIETGPDGRATLNPDKLLQIVCKCIDTTQKAVPAIQSVGISCFWHSLMGVDADGNPTTDILTWAETRSAAVRRSISPSTAAELHQRTGAPVHSSFPLIKLRWIREQCPDVWQRTRQWLSFAEYLLYQMTGTFRVSTSMASGTGLLDRQRLSWSDDAVAIVGNLTSESLSPINDRPTKGLREPFAERWPNLTSARWYPAIGDGAANNLGAGATDENRPALMVGTTGALRLTTTSPPETLPAGIWHYRIDRKRSLLGGALSEGGGVLDWLFSRLQLPGDPDLNNAIGELKPDAHGLTILPWLTGERSPTWDPEAIGTIHGLRLSTEPVEIMRAWMESIGYSFAEILDALAPLLNEPIEIIATGNGLRKNPAWNQILADILGHPLLLPRQTEASLRGAAMFALEQFDSISPAQPSIDAHQYEPNRSCEATYTRARQRRTTLQQTLTSFTNNQNSGSKAE